MVFQKVHCEECNKQAKHKQCKQCQIDYLSFFANWASGSEKIDNFIREMQLKIDSDINMVFEWIPYHQFKDIKKLGKNGFATAIWKDGPLYYNTNENKLMRKTYEKVALKSLNNSQNITNEFSNKV